MKQVFVCFNYEITFQRFFCCYIKLIFKESNSEMNITSKEIWQKRKLYGQDRSEQREKGF